MATIKKRGNSYTITVSKGYDIYGKQIRKYQTWTPDPGMTPRQIERELNRRAVLFEEQYKNDGISGGNIKLVDFADRWFRDYAEQNLKEQTTKDYRSMLPRINAALGHIPIEKLRPKHIIEFYHNLAEDGIRLDTKYHCTIDLAKKLKDEKKSRAAFAQECGVSATTMRGLCRGANVSKESAEKISAALGLSLAVTFEPVGKSSLSGEMRLHYHRFLSSMLDTAVKWQMIKENPCSRVTPPKSDTKETSYMDEHQTAELIAALDNEPIKFRTAILLLLNTGLRRGELCGLRWEDINLKSCVLTVKNNAVYIAGRGVRIDTPKTSSSARSIKLPADCVPMLEEYRQWQDEYKASMGDQWQENGFVFTSWNGTVMRPDTIGNQFSDFIKRNNLPKVTLHGLRHTNATLLIAAGTNLRTVSSRLGHSQTSTTSNIYAHAIMSADAAAADTLNSILASASVRKQK